MKTAVAGAEFYDDNVIAWEPGVNKAAAQKGAQRVMFVMKPRLDPKLSLESGRPRYSKKPYVRIVQPGDRDNVIFREAWIDEGNGQDGPSPMADNIRFPEEWKRFTDVNSTSEVPAGTPLSNWPVLGSEQVEELKHFHITTVEELANMTDANVSKFMGLRSLQRLARDFLEAAKDGAVLGRLHGELEENKQRTSNLEASLVEQSETIRQLREMLEAQKRGRSAAEVEQSMRPENVPPAPDPEKIGEPKGEERAESKTRGGAFLRPKRTE